MAKYGLSSYKKRIMNQKRHIIIVIILLLGQIWTVCPGDVQAQDSVEVVFDQDVSLRALAEKYLGDPNEWKLIVYYNGFQHLDDLRPEMKLTIPVGLFNRTLKYLQQAGETARLANMEGAGVLAEDSINTAAQLQVSAMNLKNQGNLEAAEKEALNAIHWAEKALSEAKEKKIRSVSAVLNQKEGTVQSRKPEQPVWIDAFITQELIEQERVRTLQDSLAGILFVDGSQIQLNENSLAVIGEMKENLIKKTFKAGVFVLQGDVLAHLSSLGGQKTFTITSPGVCKQAFVRKKFRTTRNIEQVTRIANYDGEIDVEANRGRVTIRKDEGTKIETGKKPDPARKLLQPPIMISPTANQVFFTPAIRFEWKPLAGAGLYQLEISTDRNFSSVIERARLSQTQYDWQAPDKGRYYYRMYTIDREQFAGPLSDPFDFYLDIDESPPYVTVHSPAEAAVILSQEVLVQGTVEKNATLTINTVPVASDRNGTFKHLVRLEQGEQTIIVTATDPAGNRTSIQRHVICNVEEQLITLNMPNQMVINMSQVAIQGEIKPHTKVEINGVPVELPQHFSHIVTLSEGEQTITLKAISPQGNIQTLPLLINVDLTPPEISLEDFPAYTREPQLNLAGSFSETVTLLLNDEAGSVKEQRFDMPIRLKEGDNVFTLEAADIAGNKTTRTLRILLDTTPPDITDYTVAPPRAAGGDIIACQVRALDSGIGLARTGSFTLAVAPGNQIFKGILTLNRQQKIFEGSVFIPPGIKGKVAIKEVRIQDRLGNEVLAP